MHLAMRKVCVFCRYNDWLISYHSSVVKVPSIERADFITAPSACQGLLETKLPTPNWASARQTVKRERFSL
jgi:hypothetical protein